MALAWIAVDVQLAQRKVTHRVVDLIRASGGCPADSPRDLLRTSAAGLLTGLWGGVGANCTDGDITGVPDSLIEEWAGWFGAPGAFARWVKEHHVSDGRIRDWDDMNGALETRREKDKERKRLEREAARLARVSDGPSTGPSTGPAQDVRVTGAPTNQPTKKPTNQQEEQEQAPPSEAAPAPTAVATPKSEKSPLPALLDRKATSVAMRLAKVATEIREGARERLSAEQQRTLLAGMVFSYWHAKVGASDKVLLDKDRERYIMLRLKECGDDVSDLLFAVDGSLRDSWHNGRKDGEKKLEIRHIFGQGREKIEVLAKLVNGFSQGARHPMMGKYADALQADDNG